ncbi:DUF2480 family protein [Chitinophaga pinensis]|uniref:DUF2480 family protein n=1 Tax=Chitinophaga pinensis (strain ATCC 43595 / DSM 2588 / LMG 13176 / NBRC 15968 / NCIMB 11800 / UQM 2034) TaxID=485918 RepID=A0A979FZZ4_CHIPD|nr:DUF2480 family protein [Chitinophaga pinensis]ACU58238.1 hypothetical protein Cpin_0740 [Chitinophaga pinensis DSM 2588]
MEEIVNKVAQSGILTLDLEDYYPKEELVEFDLKPYLFMEMILKEKDFRTALQEHNWEQYNNKNVAIFCSADAVIPFWAYMLVMTYLEPVAHFAAFGDKKQVHHTQFMKSLAAIDVNEYVDKRVVIKGCGDKGAGEAAYVEITRLLKPVVKSLMYGEPCSTVPIYKKK